MDYNGLTVGDKAKTIEGYHVEVIELASIQDDKPWVLIPHRQPRVIVRALADYESIKQGDEGGYHPTHLEKIV
jgi:hypothetical protein